MARKIYNCPFVVLTPIISWFIDTLIEELNPAARHGGRSSTSFSKESLNSLRQRTTNPTERLARPQPPTCAPRFSAKKFPKRFGPLPNRFSDFSILNMKNVYHSSTDGPFSRFSWFVRPRRLEIIASTVEQRPLIKTCNRIILDVSVLSRTDSQAA